MAAYKKGTPGYYKQQEAWRSTIKEEYGDISKFMADIGRIGGEKKVPKGWATMDREKHLAASIKGGHTSRRTKSA